MRDAQKEIAALKADLEAKNKFIEMQKSIIDMERKSNITLSEKLDGYMLMKVENEQLRAERDAAVADIYRCCDPYGGAADLCDVCSNSDKRPCKPCNWQWRGIEETP